MFPLVTAFALLSVPPLSTGDVVNERVRKINRMSAGIASDARVALRIANEQIRRLEAEGVKEGKEYELWVKVRDTELRVIETAEMTLPLVPVYRRR